MHDHKVIISTASLAWVPWEQGSMVTVMTAIAVAIINYNTCAHLRACLATIRRLGPAEVVVVDNASQDGSAAMVRAEFPEVALLDNAANRGYGAAANQAIAWCSAPYILLLNSDTLVQPGALEALGSYLDEQPHAAIVGPRIENPDGTLQNSCFPFPTPLYAFLELSNLGTYIQYIPLLRERYYRTWSHQRARVLPWVLGAALVIRRSAFEAVGGFDEAFFMYSEEVDLCYRLSRAGWQIHFAPVATVVHLGGASTAQQRAAMVIHQFTSSAQFYRRHYALWRQLVLLVIVKGLIFIKLVRDLIRMYVAQDAQRKVRLAEDVKTWSHLVFGRLGNVSGRG